MDVDQIVGPNVSQVVPIFVLTLVINIAVGLVWGGVLIFVMLPVRKDVKAFAERVVASTIAMKCAKKVAILLAMMAA